MGVGTFTKWTEPWFSAWPAPQATKYKLGKLWHTMRQMHDFSCLGTKRTNLSHTAPRNDQWKGIHIDRQHLYNQIFSKISNHAGMFQQGGWNANRLRSICITATLSEIFIECLDWLLYAYINNGAFTTCKNFSLNHPGHLFVKNEERIYSASSSKQSAHH